MPDTSSPADGYLRLAGEVIGAVLGWRPAHRSLPAPVRDELFRVLPHILVDTPSRQVYAGELAAARRQGGRGSDFDRAVASIEVRLDELVAAGLAGLDDDRLAALAASPTHIASLAARLGGATETGELGVFWWDAMSRAGETAFPEVPRATFVVPKAATPAEQKSEPRRAGNRLRWASALPWAITAAALFVAVLAWLPGGGGRTDPRGELAANSVLQRMGVLGPDDVYKLAVTSPEDGFVTVVLLPPDGPPCRVYPGYGAGDVAAAKGVPVSFGDLVGRPGTRIFAFVTPTPAAETIRKAVDALPRQPQVSETLVRVTVTDGLKAARQPWFAVAETRTIP